MVGGSRLRARLVGLAAGIAVAVAANAAPASAATSHIDAEMMCYGRDRLYISAPIVTSEDGYVDVAVPEVFRYTQQGGWRSWFKGSYVFNDDAPVVTSPGIIGGPHTWPYPRWWDLHTFQVFNYWDYYIPNGTVVAVKMWVLDGHTGQWMTTWATNTGDVGGHGTSCRAGQYAGYGRPL